jgi:methylmalonyl-CoA mutase N-terminal domain/subunit
MKLRFHTQTAGSSLTAQQPLNNIVRTTTEALAAVLGGTQSLHTNSYDEALGLPTEESAKLALRTQQIIAYETGVSDELDPLGGSYYVETLTDRLEQKATELMQKVEELGGMEKAIEAGFPQDCIERSAYEYQRAIEKGDRIIVGVNKFQEKEELSQALIVKDSFDATAFKAFKASRDNIKVKNTLEAIKTAAKSDKVLIPFIIEAARSRATTGEISDALREVFGEYRH